MADISKIKLPSSETAYNIKDARLPLSSAADINKVVTVNDNGQYYLTHVSGGASIEIDVVNHALICVNGIEINEHAMVIA